MRTWLVGESVENILKILRMEDKWSILKILNMEILSMEKIWRDAEEKTLLNVDIGRVPIFSPNVWSTAYDVIWSASTKFSGPRAFRLKALVWFW